MRSIIAAAVMLPTLFTLKMASGIASTHLAVPIMIGGNTEIDACSSYAEVAGLNPKGDGFLAVRSGPGSNYPLLEKLHNGDRVFVCVTKGDWMGVVYPAQGQDCNVSEVWPKKKAYSGPCKSGWVFSKWIQMLAG